MAVPTLPNVLPGLNPREAIVDALFRGIIGLDTADRSLFDSAFTEDAVMEINGTKLQGLEELHAQCYDVIAKLDTTHFVTNVRVMIRESEFEATLTASALAQHYRQGQGIQPGADHLLTGSLYRLELIKGDDEQWKATSFRMHAVWAEGDRAIAAGK